MNKKKIAYRITIVAVLILGYLNYFADEKGIDTKKDQVIETVGAIYEVDGYHIEANKQKDFLSKNETTFEKAKAILNNLTLTGDTGLLDSAENLFLKYNIFGKSLNGWTFKTEELKYDKISDEISTTVGVTASNIEKNIEISGEIFKSDTKMENVTLTENVKFKTKDIVLLIEKATYNDKEKVINIIGKAYLDRKSNENDSNPLSGEFQELKYSIDTGDLTSDKPFTIEYGGMKLKGDKVVLNEKTEAFNITGNVHVLIDGYKIELKEIVSDGGEFIDFIGEIKGTNGINSFRGDEARYNKNTKELILSGNIKGIDENGGIAYADEAIYFVDTKIINLKSKTLVKYISPENKIETKSLKYSTNEKIVYFYDGYDYKGLEYQSKGQEFVYNNISGEGYVLNGYVKNIKEHQSASGKKVEFNRLKSDYKITGSGYFEDANYIFESEIAYYVGEEEMLYLPEQYTVKEKGKSGVFSSGRGEYNAKSEVFKSFNEFEYLSTENKVTGYNLEFNKKTGIGKIEKDIVVLDLKDNIELISTTGEFKRDEYLKFPEDITIVKENTIVKAKSANYQTKDGKVYIPGEITFENKDNKNSGKMYDGIYEINKKVLVGNNFTGQDPENKLKSDKINYFIGRNEIVLEKNAIVKGTDYTLKGESLGYQPEKKIAKATKQFVLENEEYKIEAESGVLNNGTKIFEGQNAVIKTINNEEIQAKSMKGSFQDMNLKFQGDVKGKAYYNNIPIFLEGEIVKTYFKKNLSGKNELEFVEIEKNAVLKRENVELSANYLKINPTKKTVYGKSNVTGIQKDKYATTTAIADELNSYFQHEIVDLNGNVKIKRETSNETIITTSSKAKLKNKLNKIELRGDVLLDNGETIVSADEIDYFIKTRKVDARGDVFVDYKQDKEESKNKENL